MTQSTRVSTNIARSSGDAPLQSTLRKLSMRQAASLVTQSNNYESGETSPTTRRPPGPLPTPPNGETADFVDGPDTWLELFEYAGIDEKLGHQLSALFEKQEMPPPKNRNLLQFGIDNELLISIGVQPAGTRAKILGHCRAIATTNCSGHHRFQGTEHQVEAGAPAAVFGTQVYRPLRSAPAGSSTAPVLAQEDCFSNIPAAKVERTHRESHSKDEDSSSSSGEEHLATGGSFRVKAPEDLPVQICDICDMLSETKVNVNRFVGRGFKKFTWVDVCGRDAQRTEYASTLRKLAQRYRFATSLIVDIDLTLALPQLITAPNEPNQFLIIARVAAESTSIEEDSLHMLTNRLMIAVNLETSTIITLHRKDMRSIAQLRASWGKAQMPQSVFLCKVLDECLLTYVDALHDSESLLDEYESLMLKLTVGKAAATATSQSDQMFGGMANLHNKEYQQQMTHSGSFGRQRMNQLLYHLHRRCSVYNRMLTLMQSTLESAYSSLNITSEEYAEQMGRSCGELALKAETLHDNCQNLLNLHLALVAFRTNELMNILTTFSAVFIPITFVCSVYGMNFLNMPELTWHNGYYYCLSFQACIVIAVLSWFRVKGLI
jgi:Mg2+ and Co2+ transporter CorA